MDFTMDKTVSGSENKNRVVSLARAFKNFNTKLFEQDLAARGYPKPKLEWDNNVILNRSCKGITHGKYWQTPYRLLVVGFYRNPIELYEWRAIGNRRLAARDISNTSASNTNIASNPVLQNFGERENYGYSGNLANWKLPPNLALAWWYFTTRSKRGKGGNCCSPHEWMIKNFQFLPNNSKARVINNFLQQIALNVVEKSLYFQSQHSREIPYSIKASSLGNFGYPPTFARVPNLGTPSRSVEFPTFGNLANGIIVNEFNWLNLLTKWLTFLNAVFSFEKTQYKNTFDDSGNNSELGELRDGLYPREHNSREYRTAVPCNIGGDNDI